MTSCHAGLLRAGGHTADLAGLRDMRKTQGCAWVPRGHLVSAAAGCVTVLSLGPVGHHCEPMLCDNYMNRGVGVVSRATWVRRV